MIKKSLIVTIFNEENVIGAFLNSISLQETIPNEVVIVDGGSFDCTKKVVSDYIRNNTSKIRFRFYIKKGNRSVGRNEAIRKAKGDIILITDAGCILDKNWVKNITKPFQDQKVDVVAGYYRAKAKTIFQKCLVPYVLVMPDKVDPDKFLPATRSMAIRKSAWKEIGGFDERYSHNEDYVFANRLKDSGKKIIFIKNAIVYWIPRNTFKEAYVMFRRFAYGDMEAGIVRDKVLLLFARYTLLIYLLLYFSFSKSIILLTIILGGIILYITYSIKKNMKYVRNLNGLYLLPLLQIAADIAVMHGSLMGCIRRIFLMLKSQFLQSHALIIGMVGLYLIITLPLVNWGIPNPAHPFFYHMDEWHFMQSIRYIFSTGSSNVEGSSYGMQFFYFISGLTLIPATLIGYIDPFVIKSSVSNLAMQEKVASVLRLSTILWGVGSIVLIAKIIKSQIKRSIFLPLLLFTINPIWLTLSTYFKYDIAVVFWILLSILCFFKYEENPSPRNLMISSVVSGLTVGIKISLIPILGMFVLSFLLFTPKPFANLKIFMISLLVCLFVILVFGTPDIRTHFIDYYNLLHLNMVTSQGEGVIYLISGSKGSYLAFKQYPAIFGFFLYLLSLLSFLIITIVFIFNYLKKRIFLKKELFLCIGMLFFISSLVTLRGLGAGSNRALVLLPFMILIISLAQKHIWPILNKSLKKVFMIIFILGMIVQTGQTLAWISVKYQEDPRSSSSRWLETEIPAKTEIGIENIPIYQMLPDVIIKEFYNQEGDNRFTYQVIDANSQRLPKIVVLSSSDSIKTVLKASPKIDLINRLDKEDYQIIKNFSANFFFYDLIGDRKDFIFANLIPMPTSITIYKK